MRQAARRKLLIATAAFFAMRTAHAQSGRRPTIGFLSVNSRAAMATRTEAFQQGLRELGYVEGRNILVEYRYADAKPERLAALAAELVQMNVELITAVQIAGDPGRRPLDFLGYWTRGGAG
jgi:putative ABC transport system substrate-binding protein